MGVSFREESFVVIELGSHTTRALMNTSDVNFSERKVIRTRCGQLKPVEENEHEGSEAGSKMQVDEDTITAVATTTTISNINNGAVEANTNGPPTTAATAAVDDAKPIINGEPAEKDEGSSDVIKDTEDNSYVFGSALEAADPSTIEKAVDFIDGEVVDWDMLSAFLRYVVTKEFSIKISDNGSPVLFSVPPLWPKTDLENLAQIAFEHLNAPAILVTEQPLMAVYGDGAMTGLVIDIGHATTTVTPIIDSCVLTSSVQISSIGGQAVTQNLLQQLQSDAGVVRQFEDSTVPEEFVVRVKESGLCKLGAPGDALETVEFKDGDKTYTLPTRILHSAPQVLLTPSSEGSTPLTTMIRQAVLGCEIDKRPLLWDSIHLVGGSSRFPGLQEHLERELEATVLPASNIFANSQTREIKFVPIPDYFNGWRNMGYRASLLGASITAKIALNDSKHNITRTEYNESGPSIVHTKSY